jgi:hypothetical protein
MAKSTRPTVRIHNIESGEVIDREMTDDEFSQYEADKIDQLSIKAEIQTRAVEKQAILDRLGLTSDEVKLLLG